VSPLGPARPWWETLVRRIAGAAVLICIVLPILLLASLSAVDRGWLDRPIEAWASHKLGHAVRFSALETHLRSSDRSIIVRGLTISSPSWAAGRNLATIDRLDARLELWPLMRGEVGIPYLAVTRPTLNLIRLRDGRNNWTMSGSSPDQSAFAALSGTRTLRIVGGELSLDDAVRDLRFTGTFAQDDSASLPFKLGGRGTLRGDAIKLVAQGGPLHGAAVGRPYPFAAYLINGSLSLSARGTTGKPFDFLRYDLTISSHGPNLAGFAYLFNLHTPNSAPFSLTARARADGPHVTFGDLKGVTGKSDFAGWIRSDQSSSQHRITATIRSTHWSKDDVEAWLSPLPSAAIARSTSGRLVTKPAARWILSDEPFPAEQLRTVDIKSIVEIGSFEGYPLPLRSVTGQVTLSQGKLAITKFNAELYGGRVAGRALVDVTRPVPLVEVVGTARAIDLGRIQLPPSTRIAGLLTLRVRLEGAGRSVHSAAGSASGDASVRITDGRLPPPAAFLLGGDLLRALGTTGKKNRPITLNCARARFDGSKGKMLVRDFTIQTAEGVTTGQGWLDLGTERLHLTLIGKPLRPRLFQVPMPLLMEGSLSRPSASLLPGRNAEKLGLRGKLGVALSPLAAILPLGKQQYLPARCE